MAKVKKKKSFKTKTGFFLRLNILPPYIFHELEAMYDVYRPEFVEKVFVPETGATLEYPYVAPVPPPKKGDDGWETYAEYFAYTKAYNADVEKYKIERHKLALILGVDIISHSKRGFTWEADMLEGEWINKLAAVNIVVTDVNRELLYLKTVVFADGQDYLTVMSRIAVEEVTMSAVMNALDYFLSVMAGLPNFQNYTDLAKWKRKFIHEVLGISNGS